MFAPASRALACFGFVNGMHDCEWERVDGNSLTWSEFRRRFLEKKPVLLTGLLHGWPAFKELRWTETNILQKYGNYSFNSSDVAINSRKMYEFEDGTTLSQYLFSGSRTSWFIFPSSTMVKDMMRQADFSRLPLLYGVAERGPYVSISRGQMSNVMHQHATSFLAQVHGRKQWNVIHSVASLSHIDVAWRENVGPCAPKPAWPGLTSCVAEAGEVVYLPSGYEHETCSLGNFSIGVAYIGVPNGGVPSERLIDSWEAATEGTISKLRAELSRNSKLVRLGVGRETPGPTLLHIAAHRGHSQVIDYLLPLRADVHRRDMNNDIAMPPLEIAARAGHLSATRSLLAGGAMLDTKDVDGSTVLHWAAESGNMPLIEYLISTYRSSGNAKAVYKVNKHKERALDMAAGSGHAPAVLSLLPTGHKSKKMATQALHFACMNGHAITAQILVNHRADVNAKSRRDGLEPVALAAEKVNGGVVLRVLAAARADLDSDNNDAGNTPVHIAAHMGYLATMRVLAELRADLSATQAQQVHPTVISAAAGHLSQLQLLVDFKADPLAVSSDAAGIRWTPLLAASQEGHASVVQWLLQYKGDTQERGGSGLQTPVELAQLNGHAKVVERLRLFGNPDIAGSAIDKNDVLQGISPTSRSETKTKIEL